MDTCMLTLCVFYHCGSLKFPLHCFVIPGFCIGHDSGMNLLETCTL